MNSTFKVVFNKARGALMVVNEVTSSVQAKGTKTVVATAVAAMIAGVAGTAMAKTLAVDPEKPAIDRVMVTKDTVVEGKTFKDNKYLTKYGQNVEAEKANRAFGGLFWVERATGEADAVTLTVKSSTFENNTTDGAGAALATRTPSGGKKAVLVVEGSNFKGNVATAQGGAIANYNIMTVTDSVFEGNISAHEWDKTNKKYVPVTTTGMKSPAAGGAIHLGSESETTISGSTFKQNIAGINGGAIETRLAQNFNEDGTPSSSKNDNSGAKLTITNTTFEENTAVVNGGALYNSFYTDADGKEGVAVTGSTFLNNTAAANGGAIYNDGTADKKGNGGVMKVSKSTFTGNKALSGGAVYNTGKITAELVDYKGNVATGNGGAVVVDGGVYTQAGGSFVGNMAVTSEKDPKVETANGGAIFVKT